MKHLACISGVFVLLASGCGKKNTETPPEPEPVTIAATPTSINFPPAGGEQSFAVTTNYDAWSVGSSEAWLTASRQDGSVKLEAGANNGNAPRSATVVCTAGTVKATVSVSQAQMTARLRDSVTLADIYTAAGGSSWTHKWSMSAPMSQWYGVKLSSEGKIEGLDLSENGLSGALPEALAALASLKHCDLHGNRLTGAIPAGISQMTQLEFLDLSENSLTGAVPALGALTGLIVLDLSFNELTALPALNGLTALEYLSFCNNRLGGALPGNLSALASLVCLDASGNSFTGHIPAAWSSLKKLKVFYLYSNALDGDIPAYIANFASLEKLALDNNNLTGTIPDALGFLLNLEELYLAKNRLTGSIPPSLLGNKKWTEWKNGVCPQRDNYGFSNCSGKSSRPQTKSAGRQMKSSYKKKLAVGY